MSDRPLQIGDFVAEIFPFGVRLTKQAKSFSKPPEGISRGKIETFSAEAARRLRETFMTLYVPCFGLWAFTLTTHRSFTPEQWRALMKRFRVAVKRRGWAGIWRVELQKRKAPHAHVAFWLPPGVGHAQVQALWLKCSGEASDLLAIEHAVFSKKIPHDASGWAVYMGLHDGKRKAAQLGWLGKQWGVWNREGFEERKAKVHHLKPRGHECLLRVLRRLEWSRRKTKLRRVDEALLEQIPPEHRANFVIRSVKPPRVRSLHRGNLLRCMDGDAASRIIEGITSGRIGFERSSAGGGGLGSGRPSNGLCVAGPGVCGCLPLSVDRSAAPP